ncbi:hypothetical protein [Arcanobacterium pinnipediorum]|uniref:Uncharacterized protein n=1 Tax=Arcanobacterium pinnipediorum TaxID=1503041 RepID=A0ABY5AHN5_9ACTO|nr:hypothetical protein [Arcanobacterium pinnipediorum]USR79510.1 hypothetical protein NG665_00485 [Arcanobacterium pinnipediorum]
MNFVPATGAVRCCNPPVGLASYRIRHAGGKRENSDWSPLNDALPDDCWVMLDILELGSFLESFAGVDIHISDEEIDELIGAVEYQFERAAFGKLSYGRRADVTETQSQPGLIEIRLHEPYELGEGKYRIRIYVVEPEQPPFTGIVTLLMHVKQDGNSRLNSMQNDFMATAMSRCESWVENFPVV